MPRRMSALKQRATTTKEANAPAPLDESVSDNLADHRRREATLGGGAPEGAPTAAERLPAAQIPEAVRALTGALVQGGLDMLQTANGTTRASGSLSKRGMGERERKPNDVRSRIGRGGTGAPANGPSAAAAMTARAIAAANQRKNPFADADVGIVWEGAPDLGPRSKQPQRLPDNAQPRGAMRSLDLGSRNLGAGLANRFHS